MDFIKTIIKVDSPTLFKQQCTPANFQNILGRLKMNTAFIVPKRTKPKFYIINMDNLMYYTGSKIYNILMSNAQFIRDGSQPNGFYWIVQFYLSSAELPWNDQRMYYYEENKSRFQTILEFPCLSQNAMTYVTEVAYWSKSPEGTNYALYRAGQNIISPLLEINPYQRIQTYINNLSALTVQDPNFLTVYRSNTNPNFTTTTNVDGWTRWFNTLSTVWDNYNFTMVYNMFFIVVPAQTFISICTQNGLFSNPVTGVDNNISAGLTALIASVNNPTFLANLFSLTFPPGGLQNYNTLGSGSAMLMDLLTYWGILDQDTNFLQLAFYPIKEPIAITIVNTFPPPIYGYLETFATDPSYQYVTMNLNPLLQDSILALEEHPDMIDTFDGATTIVRLGEANICNYITMEEFGPFLRSEVFEFDLTKYSEYVQIFVEGIEEGNNFQPMYQGYGIELGGVIKEFKNTSDQLIWNWTERFTSKNIYGVQTETKYTRQGPGTKGDVVGWNVNSTFENKLVTQFANYSPAYGYENPSDPKSHNMGGFFEWAEMKMGYFNITGFNGFPNKQNYRWDGTGTAIIYLEPNNNEWNLCEQRWAEYYNPTSIATKLGVCIVGPVFPTLATPPQPLRPEVLATVNMVDVLRCYLFRLNFGVTPARMEFIIEAKHVPIVPGYTSTPLTCMNYLFDTVITPELTYSRYVAVIDQQDGYRYSAANEPKIYFGAMINAPSLYTLNNLVFTTADYIAPAAEQGERRVNLQDNYTNNGAAPAIIAGGVTVGFPGRILLDQMNYEFTKLNATIYWNVSCNWIEAQYTEQWVRFYVTSGYTNRNDAILKIPTQDDFQLTDVGYRGFKSFPLTRASQWDTRSGRFVDNIGSQCDRTNFFVNNSDTQGIKFNYEYGSEANGYLTPIYPPNPRLPGFQTYQTFAFPYIEYEPLQSFRYKDGNNYEGVYEFALPGEQVVKLEKRSWWRQFEGDFLDLWVHIKNVPVITSVYEVATVTTHKQTITIEQIPPIDPPWIGYVIEKEQISSSPIRWSRNTTDGSYYIFCQFTQPASNIISDESANFNIFVVADTVSKLDPYNTFIDFTVEDPKITKTPVLEPNLNDYVLPPGFPYQGEPLLQITDMQDDPEFLMIYLRQCDTDSTNNIQFEQLSGPPIGGVPNSFLVLRIYGYNDTNAPPVEFYQRVLKSFNQPLSSSYFANIFGINIPPEYTKAILRFDLSPKDLVDYGPNPPEWIYKVTFISGLLSTHAQIVRNGVPTEFTISPNFIPVTDSQVIYYIKIPDLPRDTRFILQTMCVDFLQPIVIDKRTFYQIIFQTNTTETYGVDAVSVTLNFSDFGWNPKGDIWGYIIQVTILDDAPEYPQFQNSTSILVNPNNSLFADSATRTYLETPITNTWNYYSQILLNNPTSVRFWIEFDLLLFGGKRDYIWDQFKHICATTYKEADFPKISNQMVLCNACDNAGYGNVKNFLLYNRYNGEERYFWQKFVKKTLANFYISFCPLASSTYYNQNFLFSSTPVWDINLRRYLTIYWK